MSAVRALRSWKGCSRGRYDALATHKQYPPPFFHVSCALLCVMSVCGARCRLCWQCCQPHISSLVGSHCSGELIIIAREPEKQRRAAVDAGIDEENAC